MYTGISSGPNARYRVWEAFTFTFLPSYTDTCITFRQLDALILDHSTRRSRQRPSPRTKPDSQSVTDE